MKRPGSNLECGVMFFSASAESMQKNKYEVVIETAKYADRHGFSSIWVPERHFTLLGGLYPNPSVLQAALAMVTERIQLRAGSVVLPLHNPLRVAEEWAMVDNLSGGRVGISFASGWNPADFTFFPDRYADRQDALFSAIPTVCKLWEGDEVSVKSGTGQDVRVRIFPRPIQKVLPTWVTAAGNPQTYVRVGAAGANLLTHLLDQGTETLAKKIELYREARAKNGHDPDAGRVSIMIHTFLGADAEKAREAARAPFCEFLKLNAGLLKGLAQSRGRDIDVSKLSADDQDAFVKFIYERFVGSRALIGSPESCRALAAELGRVGVDEILFLLDFGPSYDEILASLPYLKELKDICSSERITRHPVEQRPLEVGAKGQGSSEGRPSLDAVLARCRESVTGAAFYDDLRTRGVAIEKGLQVIESLRWREGEAIGRLRVLDGHPSSDTQPVALLLEACMQLSMRTALAAPVEPGCPELYMPNAAKEVDIEAAEDAVWCHVTRRPNQSPGSTTFQVDVQILNEASIRIGSLVVEIEQIARSGRSAHRESLPEPGGWVYAAEWRKMQWGKRDRGRGSWIVVTDRNGVGERLARVLRERGDSCLVLSQEVAAGSDEDCVSAHDAGAFHGALRTFASQSELPLQGVVHVGSLDSGSRYDAVDDLEIVSRQNVGRVLTVMKSMIGFEGVSGRPRLWLVTRGAQPVGEAHGAAVARAGIVQSPIWGLGQTFSVEHNQLWGGLLDLDPNASAEEAARNIVEALDSDCSEDLVGFRDGAPFVARLVPKSHSLDPAVRFREDASYVVTGGLGGIGRVTAQWLVSRGARHVALLGRNVPPARSSWERLPPGSPWDQTISTIRELEARGARISFASIDVGDRVAWEAYLAEHEGSGLPAIRGVFHAAGVLHPRGIADLDMSDVRDAFRAKVAGSWNIHRSFEDRDLDLFVMFSSAPPHLGALGQNLSAYNSANAFMDALAHFRAASGLPACTINWGPWSQVGLHTAETSAKSNLERLASFGLEGISNQAGMAVLGDLLSEARAQTWVVAANWARLAQNDFLITSKPFFADLVRSSGAKANESAELRRRRADFLEDLKSLTPKARRQRLVAHIRGRVVEVMGLKGGDVDWRRGLFDMGMDSLMALELKTKLQNDAGLSIPSTLAFDFPTVDAIAGYLETQLFFEHGRANMDPSKVAATPANEVALTGEQLDALDEHELEAALLAKLDTI